MCEQGMLSDEDAAILEEHIKRHSNLDIAVRHNVDISVINATIKRLKMVYDAVQRDFPDLLDPRDKSVYQKKKHSN